MKYSLFPFLLLISLFSCQSRSNNSISLADTEAIRLEIPAIDMNKILPATLIRPKKIIALETTPNSIMGGLIDYKFLENYILVKDTEQHRILVFNQDGKYLSKIESQGKGPNEYLSIVDFDYDEVLEQIFIYDQKRMYRFKLDGTFVEAIRVEDFHANFFVKLKDYYVFYAENRCNSGFCDNLIVCDENLKIISTSLAIPKNLEDIQFKGSNERRLVKLDQDLARLIEYNDVIYTILKGKITMIENLSGENSFVNNDFFNQTFNNSMDFVLQQTKNNDLGFIRDYFENEMYRCFSLKKSGKSFFFLQNRNSQETALFRNSESQLFSGVVGIYNKTFYTDRSAGLMLYNFEYLDQFSEFDQNFIKENQAVFDKISIEDNPVLFGYELNF